MIEIAMKIIDQMAAAFDPGQFVPYVEDGYGHN